MDDHVVGVLGGGQLGRMLVEAANRLNIQVGILDVDNAPAKYLVKSDKHVTGSFANASDVKALASKCDVLTYEIEHVDTKILEELEAERPYVEGTKWSRFQPSWHTVRTIQDKFTQKQHFAKYGIPISKSTAAHSSQQGLIDVGDKLGYPFMLKSRTQAYDGRGNFPVKSLSDIGPAISALAERPLYAEKWVHFKMELAVMVVKTAQEDDPDAWEKNTLAYPTVETVHEDSICKLVYVPPRDVSQQVARAAQDLARRAVSTFRGTGVFGVELFLLPDNSLLVNEIAPRPHNSGHYTIEACHMSQFEAQIRAILPDLASKIPAGATELTVKAAMMLNILGGPQPDSHMLVAKAALDVPGAKIHLYGKGEGRPGRKMGHITITGSSLSECEIKMHPLIQMVNAIRVHRNDRSIQPSADSILKTRAELLDMNPAPPPRAVIAVVMGSDTDLATLRPGLALLDTMDIPYEVHITSAHRTPQYMLDFGKAAASRGFKAIIAAAGGAAHLPGMMASETTVPVIGVPVKASSLDGLDSLMSIVQMPRGIPVATVGIGNSVNAAILAARIVGSSDEKARKWVADHLHKMDDENMEKEHRLQREGWKVYKKLDG
ncbi:phosphoribosylaminoimidazole carboxylase, ATPase subunit [Cladophialophora bantiana CBS 173.52]|uniref:Phosphoribosylaminoimidazole carboxylase n=1 Tax=Cladophialophora bantiana (strain ATCC 10958 / CBS 173.52 / CDC B-1940 / NIH 8579) TaxID=1442370 RepID=A0A0D2I0D8_CLAB1|nr:phosphoribosylaminoimidazole carboxylase, ATPase subunit [Cladophialophora bantiana CBS 173.52]KIW99183.1 phosphoribosylaminoimidazole carboxylase, ATPase subunit [Cladophialophora bantiana CBS 173.52]